MRGGALDERRERAYSLDEDYDDDDDLDRKVCCDNTVKALFLKPRLHGHFKPVRKPI